ncbi:MAG TPA: hypothetical protein VGZ22_10950 [Isosphaeraceae bacterium]|jgi:hypothetical protein|nr:hypothetical protein [Isosphaeraceae bacterium]
MTIVNINNTDQKNVKRLVLNEEDLKELFALFTSCTDHEKQQIYDERSPHFYKDLKLDEEYTYTAETREYALDAWRAVLSFLGSKGFVISRNEELIDLEMSK